MSLIAPSIRTSTKKQRPPSPDALIAEQSATLPPERHGARLPRRGYRLRTAHIGLTPRKLYR